MTLTLSIPQPDYAPANEIAVRVLHLIASPSAKEPTDSYIKILEEQIRLVRVVTENSPPTQGPSAER